jgi:hypothetical protein
MPRILHLTSHVHAHVSVMLPNPQQDHTVTAMNTCKGSDFLGWLRSCGKRYVPMQEGGGESRRGSGESTSSA